MHLLQTWRWGMSAALGRGGSAVARPKLKPPVTPKSWSDKDFLDMLNLLYCRFLKRASPIEIKQKSELWFSASDETLETIVKAPCYEPLWEIVRKYDLAEPLLKGARLRQEARKILGEAK